MIILKKLNNNFALALDEAGNEVVVYGLGVGFPKTPYNLEDESKIDQIFQSNSNDFLSALRTIPEDLLSLMADFVQEVAERLGCRLNPNLVVTLADHIQFSLERSLEGIELDMPLASDIEAIYPEEYALGCHCAELVQSRTGIALPTSDPALIAMHLVNAQIIDRSDVEFRLSAVHVAKVIDHISMMIEDRLDISIDHSSHNFSRFAKHIRYLIKRCEHVSQVSDAACLNTSDLYQHIAHDFVREHQCAREVCDYLSGEFGWKLGDDEVFYLMMYIMRFLQ